MDQCRGSATAGGERKPRLVRGVEPRTDVDSKNRWPGGSGLPFILALILLVLSLATTGFVSTLSWMLFGFSVASLALELLERDL